MKPGVFQDKVVLITGAASGIGQALSLEFAAAGARPVVFQELGCPAGHADGSLLGSTPAQQQRFFAHAFAELASEPRIRAAFVFQLVDWSPELFATMYGGVLEGEGVPQDFADRFEEWLLTTGLMTYTDGTTRPAWDTFLSAVAASP